MRNIENGVLKKFNMKLKSPGTVIVDNTITKIGEYAFSECKNVTEVILPSSLEEIGDRAFIHSWVKEIDIPNNVKRISKEAFADCKGLQYIEIPCSVTEIDEGAFSGCENLKRIVFKKHVIDHAFVFESKIEKIHNRVFENCKSLQEIDIPKTVTEIGERAFWGCSSLATLVIPQRVETIGKEAFSCCRELQNVVCSKNISEFGEGAFKDCIGLENIVLSCNISAVSKGMFENCINLKNVIIGSGDKGCVRSIESDVFVNCRALENVIFSDKLERIEKFAFFGCENLRDIIVSQTSVDVTDNITNQKRKQIYEFMLRAAKGFSDEPDIFEMVYSCGDYNIKFVADIANYGIYSIYGCDEDGNIRSKQPLCTGGVDEIVKYLNDKNNIDEVMSLVSEGF